MLTAGRSRKSPAWTCGLFGCAAGRLCPILEGYQRICVRMTPIQLLKALQAAAEIGDCKAAAFLSQFGQLLREVKFH